MMVIAVFAAIAVLFMPIYGRTFDAEPIVMRIFKTILISTHQAIRLFVVDSDFEIIENISGTIDARLYEFYSSYAALLYVIAPIMSFGVVLSFFKNVSSYRRLLQNYNKNIYVFSELNERSLMLAESLDRNQSAIIFTNVSDQNTLAGNAEQMGAICFKRDINTMNFRFHNSKKQIEFFAINDKEEQNIWNGLKLIEDYKKTPNSWLYVFSGNPESEVLLSNTVTQYMKVRRINEVKSQIYLVLKNYGKYLFTNAKNIDDDRKVISVVIVGMGRYGFEMLKSLTWFCQMLGYKLIITAIDKRGDIKTKLMSQCPELVDNEHNNNFTDNGEAQYSINIIQNVDLENGEFITELKKIKQITYVFLDVGEDEKNIRSAIYVRSICEKLGFSPEIQAMVRNSEQTETLDGITNYSGQAYNIEFIGNLKQLYSRGEIIDSDLEKEALSRHLKWGIEEDFWKYEYNYSSSIASALHKRMKIFCNVPGINKPPSERTQNEKLNLRILEHRRWNAYMRSEGYTYGKEKNNLAKAHPCLVTFCKLNEKEQLKDDE